MADHGDIEELDSCCRTCMVSSMEMFDLFSTYNDVVMAELLCSCTSVKVEKDDCLPTKVCNICYSKLTAFSDYLKQAKDADSRLRDMRLIKKVDTLGEKEIKVKIELLEIKNINDDETDVDNNLDFEYNSPDDDIKVENVESIEPPKAEKIEKIRKFSCSVCIETFSKLKYLRDHTKSVHPNLKLKAEFECFCGKTFKHHNKYLRHSLIHNKNRPFPCVFCPESFKRQSLLTNHLIIEHNQTETKPDILCEIKQTKSTETIVKKIKTEEGDSYLCDKCSATFDSSHSLAAHKKKHTKSGRILACSICGKQFKKLSHLKRHELIHDVNRPFKCSLCSKRYVKEDDLLIHMNRHKGISKGPYKCSICSKEFGQKSTLTSHVKIHTGEKPYLCPTCGKRFDANNNLKQHMRRHFGEKNFACSLCPKKFVSKGEMQSHMITHTGHRAWTCDQCGQSFTKSTSLSKHKLRHLGIRPYECDACCMKFSDKGHLKRHYRIHTGEKPYKCDLCDRAFAQSNDLVKHKRSHLGDKLYKCTQCPEGFRLKTELTQHLTHHYLANKLDDDEVPESSEKATKTTEGDSVIKDMSKSVRVSEKPHKVKV